MVEHTYQKVHVFLLHCRAPGRITKRGRYLTGGVEIFLRAGLGFFYAAHSRSCLRILLGEVR